jgi:DNA-binding cell septation regulator SpoVG
MEVTFKTCNSGKLRALADVVVKRGIIVRGFKIVEKDGDLFVAVPSRDFMADGQRRFYNLVLFSDDEVRKRFQAELLEDYEKWKQGA